MVFWNVHNTRSWGRKRKWLLRRLFFGKSSDEARRPAWCFPCRGSKWARCLPWLFLPRLSAHQLYSLYSPGGVLLSRRRKEGTALGLQTGNTYNRCPFIDPSLSLGWEKSYGGSTYLYFRGRSGESRINSPNKGNVPRKRTSLSTAANKWPQSSGAQNHKYSLSSSFRVAPRNRGVA